MTCNTLHVLDLVYAPEIFLRDQFFKGAYDRHPLLSRAFMTPIATASGVLEIAFLPLVMLVGIVVYPILALGGCIAGEPKVTVASLKAWAFSLIGFAAVSIFISIGVFRLPLFWTSFCVFTAVSISIAVHVYRACKEPVKT